MARDILGKITRGEWKRPNGQPGSWQNVMEGLRDRTLQKARTRNTFTNVRKNLLEPLANAKGVPADVLAGMTDLNVQLSKRSRQIKTDPNLKAMEAAVIKARESFKKPAAESPRPSTTLVRQIGEILGPALAALPQALAAAPAPLPAAAPTPAPASAEQKAAAPSQQIIDLQARVADLEADLAAKDGTIAMRNKKIGELQKLRDELEAKLKEEQSASAAAIKAKDDLATQLGTVSGELAAKAGEVAGVKTRLAALEASVSNLQKENATLQAASEQAGRDFMVKIEADVTHLVSQWEEIKSRLDGATTAKTEAQAHLGQVQKEKELLLRLRKEAEENFAREKKVAEEKYEEEMTRRDPKIQELTQDLKARASTFSSSSNAIALAEAPARRLKKRMSDITVQRDEELAGIELGDRLTYEDETAVQDEIDRLSAEISRLADDRAQVVAELKSLPEKIEEEQARLVRQVYADRLTPLTLLKERISEILRKSGR